VSSRLKADLSLLLVAIIWGSAFAVQRTIASQSILVFNGLRFLLAALVLFPFVGIRWKLEGSSYKAMAGAGVILVIASGLQQWGLQYTSAGNAGFITSLYVVVVPIVLWFGWREKPGWLSVFAVGLAAIGAFLLSTGGNFSFRFGDILELCGAFFWSLHVIVVGKFGSKVDPLRFAVGQALICGLLSLIFGLLLEHPQPETLMNLAFPVAYTGILSVGVGYTLQVFGQRHTPPSDAALILSLEAVMAVFFGWLFLGELLALLQVIGCILILMGVVLVQINAFRSQ
jgi:drug/metabolite transporter (DMT)-like permease